MDIRQNLFGSGPRPGGRPSAGQRGDTPMGGYDDPRSGQPNGSPYGSPMPARSSVPARPAVGRPTPNMTGKRVPLRIAKPEDKSLTDYLIYTNM
jgi:vesicle-fusing ATPase